MTQSQNSSNGPALCVLGCGTMGVAILDGLFATIDSSSSSSAATFVPSTVSACVKSAGSQQSLRDHFGSRVEVHASDEDNAAAATHADIILLACKPQVAQTLLSNQAMQSAVAGKLVISICAGVTLTQLREWTSEGTRVVRAMPNTPSKIREGMCVIACPPDTSETDKSYATSIFAPLGRCRILDEKHMDAVTGLSGSGPAFACVVLESLADGGVMMGLPRDAAIELAAQTLQGAARMVLQTGQHPAAIKDAVTTPAGCTIAGLLTMEDGKIRSTLARAVQEAASVASRLGQPPSK
ncbi:pyrroline-5-carboxylate reductase [Ramicandelaber brevisporus]|nr:pyrroline-5-carboxylate reductase [Ramicandelaber brevisporus]KAI8871677.1 pyrroline-5-carboxylate reductase [Ramicandelaber brevisporus]